MKKTITLILALFLAVSLSACGSNNTAPESPSQVITSVDNNTSEQQETITTEALDQEEESRITDPDGIFSLADAQARLLSFYHTENATYIMAACQYPQLTEEKAQRYASKIAENKSLIYHDLGAHFEAGNESESAHYLDHDGWMGALAQFDGADWNLEDIVLSVTDYSEDTDLTVDYTFSMDDMVPAEEYIDFGIYQVGDRYVTMNPSFSFDYEYHNSKQMGYCALSVYMCDVALLDQDSRLNEEDIQTDAFKFYTGDGTPVEEFFGTDFVAECGVFFKDDYMTTVSLFLKYYTQTDGKWEEELKPMLQEMIDSLIATQPYLTYTDPQGNMFTFPLSVNDIPLVFRS